MRNLAEQDWNDDNDEDEDEDDGEIGERQYQVKEPMETPGDQLKDGEESKHAADDKDQYGEDQDDETLY